MRFGKINNIILLGGSKLLGELSVILKKSKYKTFVFTCSRQLKDKINDEYTLKEFLKKNNIKYYATNNINKCRKFLELIQPDSLAIGLGEAWSFHKNIIKRFEGRLIDFMGIPLPKYRGGAHYTWMILREDFNWGCHFQVINEEMIQGKYDSGDIIIYSKYKFPVSCKTPSDYFNYAVKKEISFIRAFLTDIDNNKNFILKKINEKESVFFPRLNTLINGFINWNWNSKEIYLFINSFDSPYKGASTFINNKRVFIKKCTLSNIERNFHPYQSGLIYKIYENKIYVATNSLTLIIEEVFNEDNKIINDTLSIGMRFFTPNIYLDSALNSILDYNTEGIVKL